MYLQKAHSDHDSKPLQANKSPIKSQNSSYNAFSFISRVYILCYKNEVLQEKAIQFQKAHSFLDFPAEYSLAESVIYTFNSSHCNVWEQKLFSLHYAIFRDVWIDSKTWIPHTDATVGDKST